MSDVSHIKCPNCQHEFAPSDAYKEQMASELRQQMQKWKQEAEDKFKKRENELNTQFQETLLKNQKEQEEQLRKRIASDFEIQLKLLSEKNNENEEKLKAARKKEEDFLRKEQELKNKEEELNLTIQKTLIAERDKIVEQVRKNEAERLAIKETEQQNRIKELETQLDAQKKLAEEMKRKADQGSMQLQGEAQELALEELLRSAFPFDAIEEVPKGKLGADCIQLVRNSFATECGKIIYESKRTKAFANEWIEKLKTDMRMAQADVAVIVTEVLPRDMTQFGMKDGIWICRFSEVKPLVFLLRDSLVKIQAATASQENKGEKMQMLYNYLTGNEFKQQIEAIVEGFVSMKDAITKERNQMNKLWAEREKQLDKVLLNTTHLYGSVKGIAGNAVGDIQLLEGGE
ncbi:MAG: DUF2130 domain-containing protein [Sediminibacterium sp.]|nr:DUF2130 domain-containing protein [Sediminibacterium sp.]